MVIFNSKNYFELLDLTGYEASEEIEYIYAELVSNRETGLYEEDWWLVDEAYMILRDPDFRKLYEEVLIQRELDRAAYEQRRQERALAQKNAELEAELKRNYPPGSSQSAPRQKSKWRLRWQWFDQNFPRAFVIIGFITLILRVLIGGIDTSTNEPNIPVSLLTLPAYPQSETYTAMDAQRQQNMATRTAYHDAETATAQAAPTLIPFLVGAVPTPAPRNYYQRCAIQNETTSLVPIYGKRDRQAGVVAQMASLQVFWGYRQSSNAQWFWLDAGQFNEFPLAEGIDTERLYIWIDDITVMFCLD